MFAVGQQNDFLQLKREIGRVVHDKVIILMKKMTVLAIKKNCRTKEVAIRHGICKLCKVWDYEQIYLNKLSGKAFLNNM